MVEMSDVAHGPALRADDIEVRALFAKTQEGELATVGRPGRAAVIGLYVGELQGGSAVGNQHVEIRGGAIRRVAGKGQATAVG